MLQVVPIDPQADPTAVSPAAGSYVGCAYAAPVGTIKCEGRDHLMVELAKVEAKGGEGLMLRKPGASHWPPAYSPSSYVLNSRFICNASGDHAWVMLQARATRRSVRRTC